MYALNHFLDLTALKIYLFLSILIFLHELYPDREYDCKIENQMFKVYERTVVKLKNNR